MKRFEVHVSHSAESHPASNLSCRPLGFSVRSWQKLGPSRRLHISLLLDWAPASTFEMERVNFSHRGRTEPLRCRGALLVQVLPGRVYPGTWASALVHLVAGVPVYLGLSGYTRVLGMPRSSACTVITVCYAAMLYLSFWLGPGISHEVAL